MKASPMTTKFPKTPGERFLHALIFEIVAIGICAPVGALLLGYPLAHIGMLTLMISLMAMAWNMAFNVLFDACQLRMGFAHTPAIRALHALLFEAGLILAVVPVAAWWLNIGLLEAFVLDIGIVLFFLPYTFGFNWFYDYVRAVIIRRRSSRHAAPI